MAIEIFKQFAIKNCRDLAIPEVAVAVDAISSSRLFPAADGTEAL
jgi:hypothetical protein